MENLIYWLKSENAECRLKHQEECPDHAFIGKSAPEVVIEKLQLGERMAELLKNQAWNFKDARFRVDASKLVDMWYDLDNFS